MASRRTGLWAEIAGGLAVITLGTVLLLSGLFWVVADQQEVERRTALAESLGSVLVAQLQVEAATEDPAAGYRAVIKAYADAGFAFQELYVCDRAMKKLAAVVGSPPGVPDSELAAALHARQTSTSYEGGSARPTVVTITAPVERGGRPVAAVRLSMPIRGPDAPKTQLWLMLAYALASAGVIGLAGYGLFSRGVVAPIRKLEEGTARIAAGEFGHTIDLQAALELAHLSAALNTMSQSLLDYRERTRQQVESLEAAYAELARAQEAVIRSERLAGVGRLAAGLAHEVGNPLSAVLGYVDLMRQGLGDPELERDLVERSAKELARIDRIIRELLGYARPQAAEVGDVDPAEALSDAAATVRPTHGFEELQLQLQLEPDLPPVRMARDRLHQVLLNLLFNAADASAVAREQGDGGRDVVLSARRDGDHVEITVGDRGSGLLGEAADKAFDPFFSTKDVGKGTGLGLSTCLLLVEEAGGSMSLEPREGGGAVARVRLPLA